MDVRNPAVGIEKGYRPSLYCMSIQIIGLAMRCYFFSLLIFFPTAIQAGLDADREQIEHRIKPVGNVTIEENATAFVTTTKPTTTSATGQSTYERHCVACHQTGVAGAPKFRDEASWKPRLANADINALVASAIKGKNAMPPKGTCQECSDSDIKAAIDYMVAKK